MKQQIITDVEIANMFLEKHKGARVVKIHTTQGVTSGIHYIKGSVYFVIEYGHSVSEKDSQRS